MQHIRRDSHCLVVRHTVVSHGVAYKHFYYAKKSIQHENVLEMLTCVSLPLLQCYQQLQHRFLLIMACLVTLATH